MKTKSLTLSIALAIGLALLAARRWHDPYHLFLAAITSAVVGLVVLVHQRRMHRKFRVPQPYRRRKNRSIATAILLGLILAGGWTGLLSAIVFAADRYTHLESVFKDGDRPEFERLLDALEGAGDYTEAARRMEGRLDAPVSHLWQRELLIRLYTALVRAGENANSDQYSFFKRAIELAEANGLDNTAARASLELLNRRNSVSNWTTQAKAIEDRIKSQAAKDAEQSRLALDDSQAEVQRLRADWPPRCYALLLQWGDSLGSDLQQRLRRYQAALSFADKYHIDSRQATEKLAETKKLLAAIRPVDLPPGAKATIQVLSFNPYPPVLTCEMSIVDATGKSVNNLAFKDFDLQVAGQKVQDGRLAHVIPCPTPQQVVILLDRSSSTTGVADIVTDATARLLVQLRGIADVKVLAFANDVHVLSDFTSDPVSATPKLSMAAAAGNTAMYSAIDIAAHSLAGRPVPREMILFTDGKNNRPGPSPEELVAQCRVQGIRIHAVALETSDLDKPLLASLVERTGGILETAKDAGQLRQHFAAIAERMRQPRYRLVAFPPGPGGPLTITIGSANSVVLRRDLKTASSQSPDPLK